ncbi:MAG TPA: glycosyltransferase 87 family protein, partial [Dehalococcoidales bacterium]|nr:glycosyltransferase 87 family protein [Dehalococcoidales bacterium]
GTALCHQATDNFLAGRNPYEYANVVTAVQQFHGSSDRITPLRKGQLANVFPYPNDNQIEEIWNQAVANPSQPPIELESQVCYPAGSFLLLSPFVALGIKDIRIIYLLFVIAGLAYAVWKIPPKYRFIFIGVALVSLELWNSIANGETGAIVFPLLIVAWLSLKKNFWLSAIFMGLAVATKQTAWFMLPFYLILAWHYWGAKKLFANIGIIAGVFFVLNGYFMAANLELWVKSVLSPMLEPMFPIGVGAVTLATSGLFNIRSELIFTTAEIISGVVCLIWYFKYHAKYPNAGIILGTVPLFFAWRSLWSYFFYIGLILVAAVLTTEQNKLSETPIIKS